MGHESRAIGERPDLHAPAMRGAEFRFYEELNDFLPAGRRKRSFPYHFRGTPSVKDTVETEVDLVLVDGQSVGFEHRLTGGERVAVYPVFERLDVSPITRLRPEPLRVTRFVVDVHLGTLARYLRLLGFDTVWRNDLEDEAIIRQSVEEGRISTHRRCGGQSSVSTRSSTTSCRPAGASGASPTTSEARRR